MPCNRLPRVMKHYSWTGRRNYGRPLKRLLDTWDQNGSTSGPTPWQIYYYYCCCCCYYYYYYYQQQQQHHHHLESSGNLCNQAVVASVSICSRHCLHILHTVFELFLSYENAKFILWCSRCSEFSLKVKGDIVFVCVCVCVCVCVWVDKLVNFILFIFCASILKIKWWFDYCTFYIIILQLNPNFTVQNLERAWRVHIFNL